MVPGSDGGEHGAGGYIILAWWGYGSNFAVQEAYGKGNDGE